MRRALVGVLVLVTVLEVWLATRCMTVHRSFAEALDASIDEWVESVCEDCSTRMESQTGVYILEKGEEALIGRAWLTYWPPANWGIMPSVAYAVDE